MASTTKTSPSLKWPQSMAGSCRTTGWRLPLTMNNFGSFSWLTTFSPEDIPPFKILFRKTDWLHQGILKGEVSLYHWPPVWLVWISLFCKWKTKFVSRHTADSKSVKQEVNGTVILPPLVFPGYTRRDKTRVQVPYSQHTIFFIAYESAQ